MTDKKQQAKDLFFNTDLTKSQIAVTLGVSRRALHYWIKAHNWERLKKAAGHLPSVMAENCYHILGNLTRTYLDEHRIGVPLTKEEADTLYKLTLTIQKLKNRSTLNESMEMFAMFHDTMKRNDPALAESMKPHIEKYIAARSRIYASANRPDEFTFNGLLPHKQPLNEEETNMDHVDLFAWQTDMESLGYVREAKDKNFTGACENPDGLNLTPASDLRSDFIVRGRRTPGKPVKAKVTSRLGEEKEI